MSTQIYPVRIRWFKGEKRVVMDVDWDGGIYDEIVEKARSMLDFGSIEPECTPCWVRINLGDGEVLEIKEFSQVDHDEIPDKSEFVDWADYPY